MPSRTLDELRKEAIDRERRDRELALLHERMLEREQRIERSRSGSEWLRRVRAL